MRSVSSRPAASRIPGGPSTSASANPRPAARSADRRASGAGASPSKRTSRRSVVPWKTLARAERTPMGRSRPRRARTSPATRTLEGVGVGRRVDVEGALGAEVVLRDAPERGDGDRLLEELVEGVLSEVAGGPVDRHGDGLNAGGGSRAPRRRRRGPWPPDRAGGSGRPREAEKGALPAGRRRRSPSAAAPKGRGRGSRREPRRERNRAVALAGPQRNAIWQVERLSGSSAAT